MPNEAAITANEIRELLDYDPETGALTWRVARAGAGEAGTPAGQITHKGYLRICVNRKNHYAHRLAWLMATGEWPSGQIDHVNGDRTDNRFENLRVVENRQNCMNRALQSNNTTGAVGVYKIASKTKPWWGCISHGGKRVGLGCYRTFEEAVAARKRAERQFGYHENHGRKVRA